MFKIEYFEIFSDFFVANNQCLVIPELWEPLNWDDEKFLKNIKDTIGNEYNNDYYATDYLYVKKLDFFNKLKMCGYYSIFTAVDIKEQKLINKFYSSYLYDSVISNLVFVGWNPRCSIGSALTDGIYPLYFSNKENKVYINKNIDGSATVNKFGLLTSELACNKLCKLNNEYMDYNEGDIWYPTKIYVDNNTYKYISKY